MEREGAEMSQGMTGVLCPQMAHISVNAHVSAVFVVMMGGASVWYRAALRVCACRCVLACLPDGQCTYVCVLYSWTVHAHTVFPSDGCLLPCSRGPRDTLSHDDPRSLLARPARLPLLRGRARRAGTRLGADNRARESLDARTHEPYAAHGERDSSTGAQRRELTPLRLLYANATAIKVELEARERDAPRWLSTLCIPRTALKSTSSGLRRVDLDCDNAPSRHVDDDGCRGPGGIDELDCLVLAAHHVGHDCDECLPVWEQKHARLYSELCS
eukprot:1990193-Rhodomonas_salina.4